VVDAKGWGEGEEVVVKDAGEEVRGEEFCLFIVYFEISFLQNVFILKK
jgi:hypothetical protein